MPLLRSKLQIPRLAPNVVARPRLVERIDKGLAGRLVLVSAPAGFGKTTLLAQWACDQAEAGDRGACVGWVSLDEGDNESSRFLAYLVAAAQHCFPERDLGLLPAIQSAMAIDVESVLTTLLNAMAQAPRPVAIVLDDYHLIESPRIDQAVAFLLEHLPASSCLLIGSRSDPSLPLARLRARRQMVEVREAHLRLDASESAALFRTAGAPLTVQDVAALVRRTEGWATGLSLAALGMQGLSGRRQVAEFVASFGASHRYVIDYMVDEVLAHQPTAVQRFLLETSILDRLSGPLADAVTLRDDGQAMLEALEAANLFLLPLDGERRWFRYHQLLRDLLRRRLGGEPYLRDELCLRASVWCEEQDLASEAIQYALAGRDLERAADLIEEHALEVIDQGAFSTVEHWITALPRSVMAGRPMLHVCLAWVANLTHRLDEVAEHLADALVGLAEAGVSPSAPHNRAQGHILALRAAQLRLRRENDEAIALARRAITHLGEDDPWARSFAGLNLGLAHLDRGDLIDARHAFQQVIGHDLHRDGPSVARSGLAYLLATAQLAAVHILQGRLDRAEALCQRTIDEQRTEHGAIPATLCLVYLRLGWALAERGDLRGYFEHTAQGVLLAERIGYRGLVKAGSWSMAWEVDLAREQGYDVAIPGTVAGIVERVVSEGMAVGDQGQVIEAVVDANQSQVDNALTYLGDDAYFEVFPGFTELARARDLVTTQRTAEALDLLDRIVAQAEAQDGMGLIIEAHTTRALLHHALGESELALEAIASGLALSEPRGYVRTYADRAAPMAELLLLAEERGIMPEYVHKLLVALGNHVPASRRQRDSDHASAQPLIEPLSSRELEVLDLIAQGLSNRQICDRLYLALSTVKGHNQRIYAKLGVRRRTEAVAKARELGLIEG